MRADKRRDQLLSVAAELFAQRGYRGTTTAELAKAAGVTEPILYRHFSSKLELFVTLIDEVSAEVLQAWSDMLKAKTNGQERWRALLAGNPATHPRGRGVYRVIFQAMTEFHSDPAIARALLNHIGKLHHFLSEEVAMLQKQDVVRSDVGPDRVAWMLVSTAIGFGMMVGLDAPKDAGLPSPDAIQELLRSLLEAAG